MFKHGDYVTVTPETQNDPKAVELSGRQFRVNGSRTTEFGTLIVTIIAVDESRERHIIRACDLQLTPKDEKGDLI